MELSEAEAQVQQELETGESLLWAGIPKQGPALRDSDLTVIPFSLLFGGFAFYWEWSVYQSGPVLFRLWGIPFVLAGLYVMVGRFFVDSEQRSKTAYGLSDRRIVIVSGILARNVTSLALDQLPEIHVSEKPDRSGTINFGPVVQDITVRQGYLGARMAYRRVPASSCFDMIPEMRDVLDRIRQAQRKLEK